MQTGEIIFISVTALFLAILALRTKNIPWKKLGFTPKPWWSGGALVILFSLLIFVVVQALAQFITLPEWVLDKDPIINLLVLGACQEIIFRSLLISWLEKWGNSIAIIGSSIIFASTHLALPDPWLMTGLSLLGGLFWGWHFMKFRNIYWLIFSHLVVNLSFNFLVFFS